MRPPSLLLIFTYFSTEDDIKASNSSTDSGTGSAGGFGAAAGWGGGGGAGVVAFEETWGEVPGGARSAVDEAMSSSLDVAASSLYVTPLD